MATDRKEEKREKREQKKKAKRERSSISLPKARARLKRQKEMNRMRNDRAGANSLFTGILVVLLVLFILMGGINQRKTWEAAKRLGSNIGHTISSWFSADDIEVNDDGVYIK